MSLSHAEKAELFRVIARDLGKPFPGIGSMPGVCGGEPCIVRKRIPVWVLERARQLGSSEADLLRAYPTLRAQDIVNAWAYVDAHRQEIEQQICENEEAVRGPTVREGETAVPRGFENVRRNQAGR